MFGAACAGTALCRQTPSCDSAVCRQVMQLLCLVPVDAAVAAGSSG